MLTPLELQDFFVMLKPSSESCPHKVYISVTQRCLAVVRDGECAKTKQSIDLVPGSATEKMIMGAMSCETPEVAVSH